MKEFNDGVLGEQVRQATELEVTFSWKSSKLTLTQFTPILFKSLSSSRVDGNSKIEELNAHRANPRMTSYDKVGCTAGGEERAGEVVMYNQKQANSSVL